MESNILIPILLSTGVNVVAVIAAALRNSVRLAIVENDVRHILSAIEKRHIK